MPSEAEVEAMELEHKERMNAFFFGPKPNIKLEYPCAIYTDKSMDTILFAREGCEFFVDEHGLQWVKFISGNGFKKGKEHMLRTENVIVVRDDS